VNNAILRFLATKFGGRYRIGPGCRHRRCSWGRHRHFLRRLI